MDNDKQEIEQPVSEEVVEVEVESGKPDKRNLKNLRKFMRNSLMPQIVGSPRDLDGDYYLQVLGALGFKQIQPYWGLYKCVFPLGWKKARRKRSDKWCMLVDNKGRLRGSIFYLETGKKSVSCYINFTPRYRVKVDHLIPYDPYKRNLTEHLKSPVRAEVLDGEFFTLYITKEIAVINDPSDTKVFNQELREIKAKVYAEAEKWLRDRFPEYDNISKYWENE